MTERSGSMVRGLLDMLARTSSTLVLTALLAACARASSQPEAPTPPSVAADHDRASGAESRWDYSLRVDEGLERMQLGLCVDGPLPSRLRAGDQAGEFLVSARVRGGAALVREGDSVVVESLGVQGCIDLEIDLAKMVEQGGRDTTRTSEGLMVSPHQWLWHPYELPDQLEARITLDLPQGIHLTAPWPLEPDAAGEVRRLDASAFSWKAWAAIGRYEPLEFEAAGAEFEVALLSNDHVATRAGIEAWIRVAAETSAQLYGQFPRERVAVVVIPSEGWGAAPVHFGMARRGGGASAMLILDSEAGDERLPGEWVAVHEFLHFGMPLIADAWMAEGFVTYYQEVLRARRGVATHEPPRAGASSADQQAHASLARLHEGFERGSGGTRSLQRASDVMRTQGTYTRVYWGGAALAMDLDLRLRRASGGRRSLDDLMRRVAELNDEPRRFTAEQMFEIFATEVAAWYVAGELDQEVSPRAIAAEHLEARSIPDAIVRLEGLAVDLSGSTPQLLAGPPDEVELRRQLFAARTSD